MQGEKVTLRPIAYADTDKIIEWRNNPSVRNNFIFQKPFTSEMHTHWMNTKVARGEAIQYIIVENESGRAVGSVYFRDINLIHNNIEFGIFIGEDFARGKGYGYEITKIFSDF